MKELFIWKIKPIDEPVSDSLVIGRVMPSSITFKLTDTAAIEARKELFKRPLVLIKLDNNENT